ncbi:serine/threonine-protein kinase Sgk2 [Xylaria telfairii]|nr:serine/threonine-protein kinase Sgk2 [Xylaria telfairii]
MALSQEAKNIISKFPLDDAPDGFRRQLPENADDPRAEDILAALCLSQAAYHLPSPVGSSRMFSKLLQIREQARVGAIDIRDFDCLVRHVASHSSDIDIWEAVFNIVWSLRCPTPPPVTLLSSIAERELFFEIRNRTFRNVGGFCDKFFNTKSWRKTQKEMLGSVMAEYVGNRWKSYPTRPTAGPVWDWLCSLEDRALKDTPYKLYTTKTAYEFKERRDQMDLFFQAPAAKESGKFEYKHALVVRKQKSSYVTGQFKADFLQLTRLVKGVFIDQPTRRFVHAFNLYASTIELWVFDRSRAYSSGPFNIHDKPNKFTRALIGYATMDNNTMGLDIFIEREGKHHDVTLDNVVGKETVGKENRIELDRGVKGVARVVAHRQITTIAELRTGLEFGDRHKFRNEEVYFEDSSSVGTRDTSNYKRKLSSDHQSDTPGSKKRRSNSQLSKVVQEHSGEPTTGTEKPSLYSPSGDKWENRIYSCLVISPAGRVISDFRTIKKLLEAIRDAIKAHQSLYEVGNILHRDISSNNIIITQPEIADGFKGMLIDLDLAKERDSGPSGHQTGTMQFMAVEVLLKTDHAYRHDLESFFYVLLWLCARQSWSNGFNFTEKPPRKSCLRKWEMGSFEDIAHAKQGKMTINGLEDIMGEFPVAFDVVKPLCLRIRSILFGDTARLNFGTPGGDPSQLYSLIIAVFDEALVDM